MRELLQRAVAVGALRALDLQFARRMETLAGGEIPELLLATALLSRRVGEGDVCLDLRGCHGLLQFDDAQLANKLKPPPLAPWLQVLRRCPLVGRPGQRAALILDNRDRLYLSRYWQFEHRLATALDARAGAWIQGIDQARLKAGIERLFGTSEALDWQRVAATLAVLRPLCVITGGPGTGKTRTVTSILALLAEQDTRRPLRIALAAPTGKAAARLCESIRQAKAELGLGTAIADRIPQRACTLHRLLGFRPGRADPRHGPENPLHLDTLVVDEASMVDLPLMSRLLAALPAHTRLILLGDKDQLASVEAGMVLGDICGRQTATSYSSGLWAKITGITADRLEPASEPGPPIAEHIVRLRKSWRFGRDRGIGALAQAVNRGDGAASLQILADAAYPDVVLHPPEPKVLADIIEREVVPIFRQLLQHRDPRSALAALDQIRILCALRAGPQGVEQLNARIEKTLAAQGLIHPNCEFYPGRALMLRANDHRLGLYNGDVGLVLADTQREGALRVFFPTAEGIRRVLPARLPPHETVYAMTVHKSQGSEFEQVVLILPQVHSRVLTRELLYTGVSRARTGVRLLATEECLRNAIASPIRRATGLYDALWQERSASDHGHQQQAKHHAPPDRCPAEDRR